MNDIDPLISSSKAGPLGILHLPRLWLKILLHAAERLPAGYRHGSGGFDEALCERLGIDRDAFVAYIEHAKPDYLVLEAWVVANAKQLTPHAIAAWNQFVLSAQMRPELAAECRTRFGVTDEQFANAIVLNDLDDWASVHARLTQSRQSDEGFGPDSRLTKAGRRTAIAGA